MQALTNFFIAVSAVAFVLASLALMSAFLF